MDSMFFVSSDSNGLFSSSFPSIVAEPSKQKAEFGENDEWNLLKMGKADQIITERNKAAAFLLKSNSCSSSPNGERMLSFSSPRPDFTALGNHGTLPFYQYPSLLSMSSSSSTRSTPSFLKNGGLFYGSSSAGINGVRGAFTPAQWMELEQQALIYKYIDAKIPVPTSLVVPIRRNISLPGFNSFTAGSCRSGTSRCGSYDLGFTGNTDVEPGRCRRTDGKKWRCSREAVDDQKYCDRHLNRGRHRSRKHVEGHHGHAEKAAISIPSKPASADVSSSNLTVAQQLQSRSLQPTTMESSTKFDRIFMNKRNMNELAGDSQSIMFPSPKQQNFFEGIPKNSNSENKILVPPPVIHAQQSKSHPFLHFIDDWPKKNGVPSDRTQLSISIPKDSSDHSSPIRLVRRLEHDKRHSSCMPISWDDDPMMGGGPLGEVLTKKSRVTEDLNMSCSSSPLNLLANGWDSSLSLDSSPTGVLQKNGCFVSLSGSTASSPRAERQT